MSNRPNKRDRSGSRKPFPARTVPEPVPEFYSGQTPNEDGDFTEHNPHCLAAKGNAGVLDDCTCVHHPNIYAESERNQRWSRADNEHHRMVALDCQRG